VLTALLGKKPPVTCRFTTVGLSICPEYPATAARTSILTPCTGSKVKTETIDNVSKKPSLPFRMSNPTIEIYSLKREASLDLQSWNFTFRNIFFSLISNLSRADILIINIQVVPFPTTILTGNLHESFESVSRIGVEKTSLHFL